MAETSIQTLKQNDIGFQSNLYESKNPTRNWLHNWRRSWLHSCFSLLAKPGDRVLEVGCGCGIHTKFFAKDHSVTALDINKSFVDTVSQIPNVEALECDASKTIPFSDFFNIAVCSEVLEHVSDSKAMLRHIYQSLKPGGILILTTPNKYSTVELTARLLKFKPFVAIAQKIYKEPVEDLGHINLKTQADLEEEARATGFKLMSRTELGLYLPGIAEFMGETGLSICKQLERVLPNNFGVKWTQCLCLTKPIPIGSRDAYLDRWEQNAYPLKQVTIELQGTKHSDLISVSKQLLTIMEKIQKGELSGEEEDDDFGFRFSVQNEATSSIFKSP